MCGNKPERMKDVCYTYTPSPASVNQLGSFPTEEQGRRSTIGRAGWQGAGPERILSVIGQKVRGSCELRRHVPSSQVGWEGAEVTAVSVTDRGVLKKASGHGKNDLDLNLTYKCFTLKLPCLFCCGL